MNLISPLALLWFLPVGGAIVFLYLLKLRRRERVVSSVMLWRRAVQDLQANAPFQRLKRNLLMFLQLAAALLLVGVLARPFVRAAGLAGRSVVLIFDTSASMNAGDVRGTRMGQARRAARTVLDDLGRGDSAMVIGASARTRVITPFTADRRALARAVAGVQATDTRSDLGDALRLAVAMVGQKREPQIVILSDGAVPPIGDVALGEVPVSFVKVGGRFDNVAITGMDVRRAPTRGAAQLFVALHNFGQAAREFDLEILRDDELAHVRSQRLDPGGRTMALFDLPPGATGRLTARIARRDDLEADNRADVFLTPQRSLSVLLVTKGNLFLEKALTLDPRLEVTKATDAAGVKPEQSYDLVVCDGLAPQRLPRARGVLLIGVDAQGGPAAASGDVERPAVLDWDRRHPLTRFVDFADLPIRRAQAAQPKQWARALVEGAQTALVVAGERDGVRWAYLAFDLRDSLFPMRVGFPIFMANCVDWLAAEPAGGGDLQVRAGEIASLRVPSSAREARVTDPSGEEHVVPVSGGVVLVDGTDRVGLYAARAGNARRTFAVNLLSPEESNLTPGPSVSVGGREVRASAGRVETSRQLWRWLLAACLVVLCFEWFVYHRRL